MIIDCHYHLDERILPVDGLIAAMDDNGVERAALMAVMNDLLPPAPAPLVRAGQFMLWHGLTRPLARRIVADFTDEGIMIAGKHVGIYRDPDNEPVFAAVRRHPDRFMGWIFVNPRGARDPEAELARWQNEPGVAGVKAHPFWHRYAPRELRAAAAWAEGRGLPLLMHLGFGDHGDVLPLVDEFPRLKIVLAHAAFPAYRDTWRAIKDRPAVHLDLSQAVYVNAKTIRALVEYLGVRRCCWGTDGPYGREFQRPPFDYGFSKRRIESLFPYRAVRDRLLGANFAALVGIG